MFKLAVPVWHNFGSPVNRMNRHIIFRETIPSFSGLKIRITASDLYRLSANGSFVGYGPARAAKGHFRVDEYELSAFGGGDITIEVAGYGCRAFYTPLQENFLIAEILRGDEVIRYTGRDFAAYENVGRQRNVERFSVQRHFTEVYDFPIEDAFCEKNRLALDEISGEFHFSPRKIPYPDYTPEYMLTESHSRGTYVEGYPSLETKPYYYDYDPDWRIFTDEEIHRSNHRYIKAASLTATGGKDLLPSRLSHHEWQRYDFEKIEVGFIKLDIEAKSDSDIVIAFSEYCEGEVFSFVNINMMPVMEYRIKGGERLVTESFEVYSFKSIAVFVLSGEVTVGAIGVRSYRRAMNEVTEKRFRHPELAEIYEAAKRSFSHNAVDLYTDCPSRERAGWLCDSFFSARAEYYFFRKTTIEDAFLENYRNYKSDGVIPEGALPMCYPADYGNGGGFIPQWSIWYVLEVYEYITKRGHGDMLEAFRPSVMGVASFLGKYENEIGLLATLPGWNFVEWSDANKWVRDVNYPTNFLYGYMLIRIGELYSDSELKRRGEKIIKMTEELSFDGEIFVDNAKRTPDARYENTRNASEACQYYAAIFGGIDLDCEKYRKLKDHIYSGFADFDPGDRSFCRINAFIGLYLRIYLLAELGAKAELYKTITSHCLDTVRKTGTLWEFKELKNSLNHGFASYIATALDIADEYEGETL